jgi:hypothetical protein
LLLPLLFAFLFQKGERKMGVFASAGRVDPISGVLAGSGIATTGDGAPSTGLAGFHAILQFSSRILQTQVAQTLGAADVSASLPWGTIALPASVLALIPPVQRVSLGARGARLELRLTQPYVAGLHWPASITVGTGGVALAADIAGLPGEQKSADIGWRVELNILTPRPVSVMRAAPGASPPSQGLGAGVAGAGPAVGGTVATTGSSSGGNGGSWDRSTIAAGSATTPAKPVTVVRSDIWRFSIQLDFSAMRAPTITSDTQALTDFLATSDGKTLLSQALVRLKSAPGVSLSPDIAPAGPIPAAVAQSVPLPPLQVQDLLLQDTTGHAVLCLCVELGGASGGATALVHPFLQNSDFAYGASATILSYALKARWAVAAAGLTIVGQTQVEFGSNGGTGLANVSVTIGDTLTDVSIKAGTDGHGDILRLLGTQTIHLLQLWDPNGKQVTNLGDLGKPQELPLLMPINYFYRGDGSQKLQANFQNFVMHLMAVVGFPTLDPFDIDAASVTGFTSNPMQAMFVRWAMTRQGIIVAPGSGVFTERA